MRSTRSTRACPSLSERWPTGESSGRKIPSRRQRGSWTAKSERGVDISTKFEGKTPDGIVLKNLAEADAGAVVKFTEKDSFVVTLTDVTMQRMENTRAPRTAAAQAVLQVLRQLGYRLADRQRGAAGRIGHVPHVGVGFIPGGAQGQRVDRTGWRHARRSGERLPAVGDSSGSDDFVGKGQISPMFKAVKLKIGGIGPAGVRSFDVDPEQLPESERTVDAEDLADDDPFLDSDDADDRRRVRRASRSRRRL